MTGNANLSTRADAYRRAFDLSFSEPAGAQAAVLVDLLALRIAGQGYVLPLDGIAGLLRDRQPVPLPTGTPGLRGLIGFRGALCPVYDLATLLGHPPAQEGRWLLMTREPDPIGLSLETFEGHLRVETGRVQTRQGPAGEHPFRTVLRGDGEARPVLDLPSLLLGIRQHAIPHALPTSEE